MHELLFSPAAERYSKKLREKPVIEGYKDALKANGQNPSLPL
jgi:hypothetical protein